MNRIILFLFLIIISGGSIEAGETKKNVTSMRLKNGLNLVLIENHSSSMIASVVTVKAGSVNETGEINGISHMLEHLLFNGTSSRTQKQLYHDQDYYGIYNNAHTDRDYTNYIVLAEKDFIEKALDIQSDMLFHSIFPEDKFEKEKGIILNELARDSSNDSYWADEFFNRKFYQGTPYNLTILGTPSSIRQIKRAQVIKYYQTYYKPNNMTAIVMGDFVPDEMIALFEEYFGQVSPDKIPEPQAYHFDSANFGKTFSQKIKLNNIFLSLGFPAPDIGHKDFYAFDLFNKILNLHLKDDLNERLKKKYNLQLLEISAGFNFAKFLSSFSISATLPAKSDTEVVKNEIYSYFKEFVNREFKENEIKGLLTSLNVSEEFLFEKPHYYGMIKGAWIATGGWELTSTYIDRLKNVSLEDIKRVGKQYFSNPKFLIGITTPGDKKPEFAFKDYYTAGTTSVNYTKESLLLTELWEKEKFSEQRKSKPEKKEQSSGKKNVKVSKTIREVEKKVFKNNLTLLINSNPDSEVFAVHLLAKNRTATEPLGKEGISSFLHRLIEKRTGSRNKREMKEAMSSIGAVMKTKDSPYIPYDDYYTSREFSFVRFETIDRFYKQAIYNFSDIVLNPSFLKEDIEEVRTEMISNIRKQDEKPSKISRNLLFEELFNKNRFSRKINGTEKSINSITQKDLREYHEYYFAPNNLIISLATSINKKLILEEFEKYFKSLPRKDVPAIGPEEYPLFSKAISREVSLNKTQSYIRLGTLFEIGEGEDAGLRVLASILSESLAQNIREKKGLSYSLGAGFSTYKGYGLFQIAVGTRAESLDEVEKTIYQEIEQVKSESIHSLKLTMIINYYNSRRLMRSLSRISQSYRMGLNEFYGRPFDYNEKLLREIKNLDSEAIKTLARKYLKRENMVKIIVR